jgi:hypothetical protein
MEFTFCPNPKNRPTTKTVISTEAAHGLIVSAAAEKSASLSNQRLSHRCVTTVAALATPLRLS